MVLVPLTVYTITTNSATLSTAKQLVTSAGGVTAGTQTTLIGTSTGYGEVTAQATASAWPALGSLGNPSGKGYFLDSTVLEGQDFQIGNWIPTFRILVNTGNIVADLIVRAYRYSGGVYYPIVTCTDAGQTVTSPSGNFTWPATATAGLTSFGIGDKLYIDTWLNITTNNTASGTATVRFAQSSDPNLGTAADQVVTPGYDASLTFDKRPFIPRGVFSTFEYTNNMQEVNPGPYTP